MITTRFLLPFEYIKYADWLKSQNPETLNLYFGASVNEAFIDNLVAHLNQTPSSHKFLVAFDHDKWIGVIHIATAQNLQVEFGIIVDSAYRNRGIGDRLIEEAILWSRNRGYRKLFMHCLSWNQPIKRLCTKHGLTVKSESGDSDVDIVLPPPTLRTFGQEVAIRNQNIFYTVLNPFVA